MLKILTSVLANKSLLVPKYRLNNVSEINNIPQLAQSQQKKIFVFDKDDTLVPLHQFKVVNKQTIGMLENLQARGKQVYVVSNSVLTKHLTICYINQQSQKKFVPILYTTVKKPYNIEQIKYLIQNRQQNIKNGIKANSKNAVIVGDRLLTDVLLGNLEGWTTVLVKPIQQSSIKKHGVGVFMMRKFENLLLRFL